jgi:hypothetical protein
MENQTEKMHSIISSVPSENNILSVYDNTIKKYNFRGIQTINDAMYSEAPALASMRVKDKELAENMLKLMFAKTARAFNITRNIEPGQIVELVDVVMHDFYYLKLSEIFYVLKQAKMGKFGKTYERLDEPTILGWFNTYAEERTVIAVEQTLNKHDKYTHTEKGRQYDGFFEKALIARNKEQDRVLEVAKKLAHKMVSTANSRAEKIQQAQVPTTPQDDNNNEARVME